MTRDAQNIFKVLVRTAIANAFKGRPQSDFVEDISRLQLCGVDIGDKHHSRAFAIDAEALAARVTEYMLASVLNSPLTGLGIPTDFSVSFDGVSLGSAQFSRHETAMASGATASM